MRWGDGQSRLIDKETSLLDLQGSQNQHKGLKTEGAGHASVVSKYVDKHLG